MTGGVGNDTYAVTNPWDIITKAANGGTDTVYSGVSFAQATNWEVLQLNKTGNILLKRS